MNATTLDRATLDALAKSSLADIRSRYAEHIEDDAIADQAMRSVMRAQLDALTSKREGGLLAQRVSLGSLLRDGVPPVTFLPSPSHGERLFYEGHVFLFAGHKKAGKSWSMTLQARDMLNAERPVVYVDNENGPHTFTRRLATVGVAPYQADEFLHYIPFPKELKLDALRDEFDAIRAEPPGALVVIDSLRSLMSRFELNPDKQAEVEAVFGPIMGAVKADGTGTLTVGVIDHANRSTKATDAYAAGGSAGKAQAVDAVYYFDKIEPFSVEQRGAVKVLVKDDREGLLDFERAFRVGGQGEGQSFAFEPADAADFGTVGRILLDVRQYMMDSEGEQTKNSVRQAVKGDNTAVDRALEALARDPSEPVWSVLHGQRVRFLWDEARVAAPGLAV